MKLKYKVLWIEDQMKSIRGKYRIINKYIEDKGFDSDIEHIDSYDKFENEIGYDGLKDYDLLLVDLNLDETEEDENDGNKIIANIRGKNIYTEIVFYSSQYEDLQNRLQEHFIEGIFTAERKLLETKAKNIIDVTLHKVQDINNLRGLIMAEVAELDILKEEIINKAAQKIDGKSLEKYVLKKIKASGKSCTNQAESHLSDIDNVLFESLFGKIGFVDSNKKAMVIGEALKKLGITEPVCKDTFTQPYIDTILTKRNKFAHIKESDINDGNGNSCKHIADIPFTEEKCIEIRKEIKKYKKVLEDIKNSIWQI